MTKNTLTIIGFLGIRRAYLNISEAVAIERYKKSERLPDDEDMAQYKVETFEFDDEFSVYDAWEKSY